MLDFTRAIEKIVPEDDGPGKVVRRKFTVAAINGDNTVNITDGAGVTTPNVPVLAGAQLIVGSKVQVLSERGAMLVLGKVGASIAPPTVLPAALMGFGTPTIADNSVTALTPTVTINDGGMYPGSGTVFTIPVGQGGFYTMGLVLRYSTQSGTAAVGHKQARIHRNGSEYMAFQMPVIPSFNTVVAGVIRIGLVAGDTISFHAYQNSGSSQTLVGNGTAWIERVR